MQIPLLTSDTRNQFGREDMEFLVGRDHDEGLPFLREQQAVMVWHLKTMAIGSADNKRLKRCRVSNFFDGAYIHALENVTPSRSGASLLPALIPCGTQPNNLREFSCPGTILEP